jgi:hypothetical protein
VQRPFCSCGTTASSTTMYDDDDDAAALRKKASAPSRPATTTDYYGTTTAAAVRPVCMCVLCEYAMTTSTTRYSPLIIRPVCCCCSRVPCARFVRVRLIVVLSVLLTHGVVGEKPCVFGFPFSFTHTGVVFGFYPLPSCLIQSLNFCSFSLFFPRP